VLAAFIEEQAAQCGYCISGILMRITALLKQSPDADESVIRASFSAFVSGWRSRQNLACCPAVTTETSLSP
jgi:aerobic-type carbon monoxide dehydrogenase small subunit (CoxS/CutS family)